MCEGKDNPFLEAVLQNIEDYQNNPEQTSSGQILIPFPMFEGLYKEAKRVEQLEKRISELNREIGHYASQIGAVSQTMEMKISDMRSLATKMCLPEENENE